LQRATLGTALQVPGEFGALNVGQRAVAFGGEERSEVAAVHCG
jgi:hypothetical protein